MSIDTQHIGETILSRAQIQSGVTQVAKQLNNKFNDQSAIIITVVPGGILFTADLVRELNFPIAMETISCPHTPGERHNRSEIVFHQNVDITGQHIIIIDDAIESGGTMKRLAAYINDNFAIRSLTIATLFVKPNRVSIAFEQHFAYEMKNDDLLVGYGLPWRHHLRNIPYISTLINTENK
jgi:hypoxanthine phosphoribosyltransferase